MPRKRMISPEIWTNEDFGSLTPFDKLVYIGTISMADDDGRLKVSPNYLKAVLFPYNDIRISDIQDSIERLTCKSLLIPYGDYSLAYHPNWSKWQKIDRPSPSKLPSPNNQRKLAEPSPPIERNRTEVKGNNTDKSPLTICPDCKGHGVYDPGYNRHTCTTCKGKGSVWKADLHIHQAVINKRKER